MENTYEPRSEFQIILDNNIISLLRIINSNIRMVLLIWRSENNLIFRLRSDFVNSGEYYFLSPSTNADIPVAFMGDEIYSIWSTLKYIGGGGIPIYICKMQ